MRTILEFEGERFELTPPHKIVTSHVFPPIPDRRFDWCAWYDGHEEGPQGFGRTEDEARRDLINNYDAA
jgi:hypothetical protein